MLVNNASDLNAVRTQPGRHLRARGSTGPRSSTPARSRISRRSRMFTGVFDGQGQTIANLTIAPNNSTTHNVGLFGVIGAGGVVRDLNLANVNVTANPGVTFQTVGTLAGTNLGTVSGVTADGTVNGGTATDAALGGLVGANGGFNFGIQRRPDHQLARGRRREQRRHQRGVGRARRIQRAGLDHLRLIRQRRRDRHRQRQQGRRGLRVQQFVPACVRRRPGRRQPRHHRLLVRDRGCLRRHATAPPAGSSVSTAASSAMRSRPAMSPARPAPAASTAKAAAPRSAGSSASTRV